VNEVAEEDRRDPESVAVTVRRFASGEMVVQVTGELCGDVAAAVRRVAADELMRSPSLLAMDLCEVTRMDGSGVDALVAAAGLAAESDIALCLVGAQAGPVATALAAADLTEMFEIFASIGQCEPTLGAHADGDQGMKQTAANE
jgi:anti-sigma B factor antagonist